MTPSKHDVFLRETGRFLVEEHGFTQDWVTFERTDTLMRQATLSHWRTGDETTLVGRFALGLPGLSVFGVRRWKYALLATTDAIATPADDMRMDYGADGTISISADATALLERITREFLVRYRDPEDLYALVRDHALADPSPDDDFHRLHLHPPHDFQRLGVAAAYAAFLGHDADVEQLLDLADRRGLRAPVEADALHGRRAR